MTTQLFLYEHADGYHLVTYPGAAILLGDPAWHRVGPVEVQGVDVDAQSLFAEALAWGKVYGEALHADQWDEMRDEQASRFAARLSSTKKDAPAVTDAQRLDWLLPNLHPANFGLDFSGGYEWEDEAEFLRKWRDAIDAAMTAAPPATDEGSTL